MNTQTSPLIPAAPSTETERGALSQALHLLLTLGVMVGTKDIQPEVYTPAQPEL